jgi:hypothetical protein
VDASIRTTRSAADPFNLKQPAARLEIRRNFFSSGAGGCLDHGPQWDKKCKKKRVQFKMANRKNHTEDMVKNA